MPKVGKKKFKSKKKAKKYAAKTGGKVKVRKGAKYTA